MKKKLFICLLASVLSVFCACSSNDNARLTDADEEMGVSVYEGSDGKTIYSFDLDGSKTEPVENKNLKKHTLQKIEVSAAPGSISLEKAEEILDSCSRYRLYIPGTVAEMKKQYNETITFNGKEYYAISFYLEKDGVRRYVGSDVIVACDGSDIYRLDLSGSYQKVEADAAQNDKPLTEIFKGTGISAKDALFSINNYDPKTLGLEEEITDYTFEISDQLAVKRSISCYRITPKLRYANSVKLCSPIFVAADGSGRTLLYNSDKDDYTIL